MRAKFASATLLGIAWCALSVWLSQAWLRDLGELIGAAPALFVIAFIAYVPGFMNAFMAGSILLDRRPRRRRLADYPGVTVLVACYNEAANIGDTLTSLFAQDYPGPLEVLVLDDGSTDDSAAIAERAIAAATVAERHRFRVVRGERNVGKAGVLNRGLAMASHELIVTIDGDSWAFRDALTHIVERYHNDPPDTCAVLQPDWGLSAQLRVRYAHSTTPGEFDYYSPRWYAEALPTLQIRRSRGGWVYQGAVGWGRQQDSGSDARRSRLAEFLVQSPRRGRDWYLRAGFIYSDTPTVAGAQYGYRQLTLQALRTF